MIFVVRPGAMPGAIRLAFGGALGKSIDAQGDLVLNTSGGDMVEHAPSPIRSSMASSARWPAGCIGPGGQVTFRVGHYDHSKALVIDPVMSLSYSTYLGGAGALTKGNGIAVDSSGDTYLTGVTMSPKFPATKGAFQTSGPSSTHRARRFRNEVQCRRLGAGLLHVPRRHQPRWHRRRFRRRRLRHGLDVRCPSPEERLSGHGRRRGRCLVTKLNARGSAARLLDLSRRKRAGLCHGHRGGQLGDAYVTGDTYSTNFPTTPGSLQPGIGHRDSVRVRAESHGVGPGLFDLPRRLAATAYANGIAVDGSGNAYVTGWTPSGNFPTTPGAFLKVLQAAPSWRS